MLTLLDGPYYDPYSFINYLVDSCYPIEDYLIYPFKLPCIGHFCFFKPVSLALLLVTCYKYKKSILSWCRSKIGSEEDEDPDHGEPPRVQRRGAEMTGVIRETEAVTVQPRTLFNRTETFKFAHIETIERLTVNSNEPINIDIVKGGVGYNYLVVKVERPKNHSVEVLVKTIRYLDENEKIHNYVLLQQGDLVGVPEPDEIIRLFPKEQIQLERVFENDITGIVVGAVSKDKLAYATVTSGGIGQKNIGMSISSGDNVTKVIVKIFTH